MTSEIQGIFDELQRKGYFQPDQDGAVASAIAMAVSGTERIVKRERHFAYLQAKKEQKAKDADAVDRAYDKGVRTTYKHLLRDFNSFMVTAPDELYRKLKPMRDRWEKVSVELTRRAVR